jgi:hypothetical protein
MQSEQRNVAGEAAKSRKRLGVSWTAVFTLVLGLVVNSSIVREAGALLLAAQSNGTDIAADYVKAQLRKTHFTLVDDNEGIQVVSDGPLIKTRETPFTLTGRGDPDLIVGATVALNSFSHVCPKPILGRAMQPGDAATGHRIVLLSERLWRRRFDADPALIGKTITLNKHAYTVIGIMPADFWFPYRSDPVELWIPAKTAPDRNLLIT